MLHKTKTKDIIYNVSKDIILVANSKERLDHTAVIKTLISS